MLRVAGLFLAVIRMHIEYVKALKTAAVVATFAHNKQKWLSKAQLFQLA